MLLIISTIKKRRILRASVFNLFLKLFYLVFCISAPEKKRKREKAAISDVARLLNSANPLFNVYTSAVKQQGVSECTRGAAVFNNFSAVLNTQTFLPASEEKTPADPVEFFIFRFFFFLKRGFFRS
jgi:hypothetical protein